jgi:hypothetical protein
MSKSTFRFLHLPKELRLLIYEYIPITTRHHVWDGSLRPGSIGSSFEGITLTLVIKSTSISILLVSSVVYNECKHILHRKLKALRAEPLRLIVDLHNAYPLMNYNSDNPTAANNLLQCLEDYRKFKYEQGHLQPGEEREFESESLRYNFSTSNPNSARLINFIDLMTVHRENRSPDSSIIALKSRCVYTSRRLPDFIGAAAQGPTFGFPAPTWTMHPLIPHDERSNCDPRDEFTKVIRTYSEDPELSHLQLVEHGTLEEWTRDWEEG